MSALGKVIAKQRAAKRLTIRDVATLTRLSRQAVWNAERGIATLPHAARIARALGLSFRVTAAAAVADTRRIVREVYARAT